MKRLNLIKQRGAVLAFTLIMLLLLTLVGVSMIQQNKQELGMAGNARLQTQALSTAESELSNAETAIDAIRYDLTGGKTKNDKVCNAAPQLDENTVLTPMAIVKEVYCLWGYQGAEIGGTEQRCIYNNGQRDLDNPPAPNNACIRLNQAGPGTGIDISLRCPTELYTIHTTFTDSKGAERTVESKYAVRCTDTPL